MNQTVESKPEDETRKTNMEKNMQMGALIEKKRRDTLPSHKPGGRRRRRRGFMMEG